MPPSARLVPPSARLAQSTGLMSLKGSDFHCGSMSISTPTRNTASKGCVPVSSLITALCTLSSWESGRPATHSRSGPGPRSLSQPPSARDLAPGKETFTSCTVFCLDWSGSGPLSLKPGQAFGHLHNHVSNYRGPWRHAPSRLGRAV